MNSSLKYATTLLLGLGLFTGCGKSADDGGDAPPKPTDSPEAPPEPDGGGGHGHDEASLGTVTIGELEVALAQGHGAVEAGGEEHLVVKLPYSDNGGTVVRAWIGTEDRTLSFVGKGTYSADHDDYNIHAMAPDPLPDGAQWWIEIEKPDGTKSIGSAQPLFE